MRVQVINKNYYYINQSCTEYIYIYVMYFYDRFNFLYNNLLNVNIIFDCIVLVSFILMSEHLTVNLKFKQ
jgi:hypothetical protein